MRAIPVVVLLFGATMVCGTATSIRAQTAVLSGTVLRDSTGKVLAGAQVSIPSLQLTATTNYRGEFRLDRLPAGRHAILVRHLGFAPLSDTIALGDGARVDREFVLEETPQQLDAVVTKAPEKKYISPGLQDFEERSKQGFGHFITEEQLRKDENRDMVNIIVGRVPGLTRFRFRPNSYYIGTARKCGNGPAFLTCRDGGSFCPVSLYVDGALVFNAANARTPDMIPDLSTFRATDYAGIEYYAGGATTPSKYNATSAGCGVLLLWTRER